MWSHKRGPEREIMRGQVVTPQLEVRSVPRKSGQNGKSGHIYVGSERVRSAHRRSDPIRMRLKRPDEIMARRGKIMVSLGHGWVRKKGKSRVRAG